MKEGKFKFMWVLLATVAVIVVTLGAFVNAFLIYLDLLLLGGLLIHTMFKVENIYLKAKPMEEPEEVPKEETPKVQDENQQRINMLLDYIVKNYQQGANIKDIEKALLKKYNPEFVKDLIDYFNTEILPQLKE